MYTCSGTVQNSTTAYTMYRIGTIWGEEDRQHNLEAKQEE